MKITRRKDYEKWLRRKGKEWLEGEPRSEGVHVSDTMYPRKWYFRQQEKYKDRELTDAELGYFLSGKSGHYFIEAMIAGKDHEGSDAGEFEWEGIYYSPDVADPLIEVKTTRKRGVPPEKQKYLLKEFDMWLDQLIRYAAIENKLDAHLVPFYLNKPLGKGSKETHPQVYWFSVKFTKAELEKCRQMMKKIKDDMLRAKKKGDHSKLPCCPEWQCGWFGKQGFTPKCPFYEDCLPETIAEMERLRKEQQPEKKRKTRRKRK